MESPQPTTGVRRPPPSPASGTAEERIPAALPPPPPLIKHKSYEAWSRQKMNHERRRRRSKSLTDEDLSELRACIELGFGFDSPDTDHGLSNILPALGLYYAVNKQYYESVSKKSSSLGSLECDSPSSGGSPQNIFGPGENPKTVKTRLRQWAQVVACSLRQSTR